MSYETAKLSGVMISLSEAIGAIADSPQEFWAAQTPAQAARFIRAAPEIAEAWTQCGNSWLRLSVKSGARAASIFAQPEHWNWSAVSGSGAVAYSQGDGTVTKQSVEDALVRAKAAADELLALIRTHGWREPEDK